MLVKHGRLTLLRVSQPGVISLWIPLDKG